MTFADSYLTAALILFNELQSPTHYKRETLEYQLAYKYNSLLIAALWNFKHAIEITLKSLTSIVEEHYLPIHNIEDLAQHLVKFLIKRKLNHQKM